MSGGVSQFSPPRSRSDTKQTAALIGLPGFGDVPRQSRNVFPISKSRYQTNEIRRRQRKLAQFAELVAAGATRTAAANKIRVPFTTLWRWQQQLEPRTNACGRKSTFDKLKVPHALVERVQRLQLSGRSNAAAWKIIAGDPDCPKQLANFLRNNPSVPDSFLKASRLERIRTTAVRAGGFLYLQTKNSKKPML